MKVFNTNLLQSFRLDSVARFFFPYSEMGFSPKTEPHGSTLEKPYALNSQSSFSEILTC